MAITEYIPKTSDDDPSATTLDNYCDKCEEIIVQHRGWSRESARRHVGRFMHIIPTWAGASLSVEDAVARMIGGNPATGYK